MPTHSKHSAQQVQEGLERPENKEIPNSILYDDRGSELYEQITALEEYYPFTAEESLLKLHARDIAAQIPRHSVIVELGCGTARKSAILVAAVQALHGRCEFVGIDVSASFLQEAGANLMQEVAGLSADSLEMVEADYMEGLRKVRALFPCENLCIMWLGNTVGNMHNVAAAIRFFKDILATVGDRCQIFLCADMWKDKAKLYAAYHDKEGVTELFIKNGMRCALALLGHATTAAQEESWVYEVVINETLRRVEMYLTFTQELVLPDRNIHVRSGERVLVEVSRKFSVGDLNHLANAAGFHIDVAWRDNVWGMQMLVPFKAALVRCWAQTDLFFHGVEDWCQKPIDVRHPFKFYYGHVQAFAKLKLLPNSPPSAMDIMFSRGIDPNVVDPTKCHSHPEVPPEWPAREEIEAYVHERRPELLDALAKGETSPRVLVLVLEHEYMHVETLAYMRTQERKAAFEKKMSSMGTKPRTEGIPNGGAPKDVRSNGVSNGGFPCIDVLKDVPSNNGVPNGIPKSNGVSKDRCNGAANGAANGVSNGVIKTHTNGATNGALSDTRGGHKKHSSPSDNSMLYIAPGDVTLGGNPNDGSFMWDNECPEFMATVADPFWVSRKPVTVSEFLTFIKAGGYEREEYWEPLDFSFVRRQKITLPATWSEIDGDYFVHSPDATEHWACVAGRPVFVSLSEAEAFCTWARGRVMTEPEYHLILASDGAPQVEALRTDGWEWTSTPFHPFPGYEKMPEYPEYSSDFFDGCHYVLKGASPVTHPCMRRDTFRNFFQRQYPYVFAKFRVCKNATS